MLQVTVFGESAGAIAISLMYLQEDINLFRGAVSPSLYYVNQY
jgi:carboxylesterase type B